MSVLGDKFQTKNMSMLTELTSACPSPRTIEDDSYIPNSHA